MDRKEYLQELKHQLKNLPVEEQEEALEYYRGYFEDADNDEEVMKEFGTPEELAKSITEKFACVPSVRKTERNNSDEGNFGSYSNKEVRSLDIALGAAEIVMATGDTFSVDYRGIKPGDITYGLSAFGTFFIQTAKKIPDFIWNRDDARFNHPRILIKIPENTKLDVFKLSIGAGNFSAKNVNFKCDRSYINVGAGNIALNRLDGGAGHFKCGMGNINFTGKLSGLVKADCGMGNISFNLDGNPDDYSINAFVGLGCVRFNEIKKDAFGNLECNSQKQNHFSVNCGMGSVNIKMK